jgi:hypothetical protein
VVEQPIRNRQVASSTLALGSTIFLKLLALSRPIPSPFVATPFAVPGLSFSASIAFTREFANAFLLNIHCQPGVAVTPLNKSVIHASLGAT